MPVLQQFLLVGGNFLCYIHPLSLRLIHKTDGYDIIYKWFDHLKSKGHTINGCVIRPNHVHALISFVSGDQTINTIVGNGKRFMAYEIIKRLEVHNEINLLSTLRENVEAARRVNNKKHEV